MTAARRAAAVAVAVLAAWTTIGGGPAHRPDPASAQSDDLDLWELRQRQGWRDQIGGGVPGLAVEGDRLYAVVGARLHIYDVADAGRVRRLGRSLPWFGSNGNQHHDSTRFTMYARGNGVYASGTTQAGLLLGIDVSQPAQPRLVARPDTFNLRSMSLVGNDLVTLQSGLPSAFITWWPTSDPTGLASARSAEVPRLDDLSLLAVRARDRQALAVLPHGDNLLHWLDLSTADETVLPIGEIALGTWSRVAQLQMLDDRAVALTADERELLEPLSLFLLDAREPASLAVRSSLPLSATTLAATIPWAHPAAVASEMTASETHAYVPITPLGQPRIASIDISNAAAPRQVGSAPIYGSADELRLADDRLSLQL